MMWSTVLALAPHIAQHGYWCSHALRALRHSPLYPRADALGRVASKRALRARIAGSLHGHVVPYAVIFPHVQMNGGLPITGTQSS